MANANTTAAQRQSCKKALAADAMVDLCKFIGITKENQQALNVWNEYLTQSTPVIEVTTAADGQPIFFLSKPLASFVAEEVTA